jgi:hypothetical protein
LEGDGTSFQGDGRDPQIVFLFALAVETTVKRTKAIVKGFIFMFGKESDSFFLMVILLF